MDRYAKARSFAGQSKDPIKAEMYYIEKGKKKGHECRCSQKQTSGPYALRRRRASQCLKKGTNPAKLSGACRKEVEDTAKMCSRTKTRKAALDSKWYKYVMTQYATAKAQLKLLETEILPGDVSGSFEMVQDPRKPDQKLCVNKDLKLGACPGEQAKFNLELRTIEVGGRCLEAKGGLVGLGGKACPKKNVPMTQQFEFSSTTSTLRPLAGFKLEMGSTRDSPKAKCVQFSKTAGPRLAGCPRSLNRPMGNGMNVVHPGGQFDARVGCSRLSTYCNMPYKIKGKPTFTCYKLRPLVDKTYEIDKNGNCVCSAMACKLKRAGGLPPLCAPLAPPGSPMNPQGGVPYRLYERNEKTGECVCSADSCAVGDIASTKYKIEDIYMLSREQLRQRLFSIGKLHIVKRVLRREAYYQAYYRMAAGGQKIPSSGAYAALKKLRAKLMKEGNRVEAFTPANWNPVFEPLMERVERDSMTTLRKELGPFNPGPQKCYFVGAAAEKMRKEQSKLRDVDQAIRKLPPHEWRALTSVLKEGVSLQTLNAQPYPSSLGDQRQRVIHLPCRVQNGAAVAEQRRLVSKKWWDKTPPRWCKAEDGNPWDLEGGGTPDNVHEVRLLTRHIYEKSAPYNIWEHQYADNKGHGKKKQPQCKCHSQACLQPPSSNQPWRTPNEDPLAPRCLYVHDPVQGTGMYQRMNNGKCGCGAWACRENGEAECVGLYDRQPNQRLSLWAWAKPPSGSSGPMAGLLRTQYMPWPRAAPWKPVPMQQPWDWQGFTGPAQVKRKKRWSYRSQPGDDQCVWSCQAAPQFNLMGSGIRIPKGAIPPSRRRLPTSPKGFDRQAYTARAQLRESLKESIDETKMVGEPKRDFNSPGNYPQKDWVSHTGSVVTRVRPRGHSSNSNSIHRLKFRQPQFWDGPSSKRSSKDETPGAPPPQKAAAGGQRQLGEATRLPGDGGHATGAPGVSCAPASRRRAKSAINSETKMPAHIARQRLFGVWDPACGAAGVFNARYYYEMNPDLTRGKVSERRRRGNKPPSKALGCNLEYAYDHYVHFGRKQGRQGCIAVDRSCLVKTPQGHHFCTNYACPGTSTYQTLARSPGKSQCRAPVKFCRREPYSDHRTKVDYFVGGYWIRGTDNAFMQGTRVVSEGKGVWTTTNTHSRYVVRVPMWHTRHHHHRRVKPNPDPEGDPIVIVKIDKEKEHQHRQNVRVSSDRTRRRLTWFAGEVHHANDGSGDGMQMQAFHTRPEALSGGLPRFWRGGPRCQENTISSGADGGKSGWGYSFCGVSKITKSSSCSGGANLCAPYRPAEHGGGDKYANAEAPFEYNKCGVGRAGKSIDRAFVTSNPKKQDGAMCKCGWSLDDIANMNQSMEWANKIKKRFWSGQKFSGGNAKRMDALRRKHMWAGGDSGLNIDRDSCTMPTKIVGGTGSHPGKGACHQPPAIKLTAVGRSPDSGMSKKSAKVNEDSRFYSSHTTWSPYIAAGQIPTHTDKATSHHCTCRPGLACMYTNAYYGASECHTVHRNGKVTMPVTATPLALSKFDYKTRRYPYANKENPHQASGKMCSCRPGTCKYTKKQLKGIRDNTMKSVKYGCDYGSSATWRWVAGNQSNYDTKRHKCSYHQIGTKQQYHNKWEHNDLFRPESLKKVMPHLPDRYLLSLTKVHPHPVCRWPSDGYERKGSGECGCAKNACQGTDGLCYPSTWCKYTNIYGKQICFDPSVEKHQYAKRGKNGMCECTAQACKHPYSGICEPTDSRWSKFKRVIKSDGTATPTCACKNCGYEIYNYWKPTARAARANYLLREDYLEKICQTTASNLEEVVDKISTTVQKCCRVCPPTKKPKKKLRAGEKDEQEECLPDDLAAGKCKHWWDKACEITGACGEMVCNPITKKCACSKSPLCKMCKAPPDRAAGDLKQFSVGLSVLKAKNTTVSRMTFGNFAAKLRRFDKCCKCEIGGEEMSRSEAMTRSFMFLAEEQARQELGMASRSSSRRLLTKDSLSEYAEVGRRAGGAPSAKGTFFLAGGGNRAGNDESFELGEGVGRRAGGGKPVMGQFSLAAGGNRAGNDESLELGEGASVVKENVAKAEMRKAVIAEAQFESKAAIKEVQSESKATIGEAQKRKAQSHNVNAPPNKAALKKSVDEQWHKNLATAKMPSKQSVAATENKEKRKLVKKMEAKKKTAPAKKSRDALPNLDVASEHTGSLKYLDKQWKGLPSSHVEKSLASEDGMWGTKSLDVTLAKLLPENSPQRTQKLMATAFAKKGETAAMKKEAAKDAKEKKSTPVVKGDATDNNEKESTVKPAKKGKAVNTKTVSKVSKLAKLEEEKADHMLQGNDQGDSKDDKAPKKIYIQNVKGMCMQVGAIVPTATTPEGGNCTKLENCTKVESIFETACGKGCEDTPAGTCICMDKNKTSGLPLNVTEKMQWKYHRLKPGTPVVMWNCNKEDDRQSFVLDRSKKWYHRIRVSSDDSLCVGAEIGKRMTLYDCKYCERIRRANFKRGTGDKLRDPCLWRYDPGNGAFKGNITANSKQTCLKSASFSVGAPVISADCNIGGDTSQVWDIPVPGDVCEKYFEATDKEGCSAPKPIPSVTWAKKPEKCCAKTKPKPSTQLYPWFRDPKAEPYPKALLEGNCGLTNCVKAGKYSWWKRNDGTVKEYCPKCKWACPMEEGDRCCGLDEGVARTGARFERIAQRRMPIEGGCRDPSTGKQLSKCCTAVPLQKYTFRSKAKGNCQRYSWQDSKNEFMTPAMLKGEPARRRRILKTPKPAGNFGWPIGARPGGGPISDPLQCDFTKCPCREMAATKYDDISIHKKTDDIKLNVLGLSTYCQYTKYRASCPIAKASLNTSLTWPEYMKVVSNKTQYNPKSEDDGAIAATNRRRSGTCVGGGSLKKKKPAGFCMKTFKGDGECINMGGGFVCLIPPPNDCPPAIVRHVSSRRRCFMECKRDIAPQFNPPTFKGCQSAPLHKYSKQAAKLVEKFNTVLQKTMKDGGYVKDPQGRPCTPAFLNEHDKQPAYLSTGPLREVNPRQMALRFHARCKRLELEQKFTKLATRIEWLEDESARRIHECTHVLHWAHRTITYFKGHHPRKYKAQIKKFIRTYRPRWGGRSALDPTSLGKSGGKTLIRFKLRSSNAPGTDMAGLCIQQGGAPPDNPRKSVKPPESGPWCKNWDHPVPKWSVKPSTRLISAHTATILDHHTQSDRFTVKPLRLGSKGPPRLPAGQAKPTDMTMARDLELIDETETTPKEVDKELAQFQSDQKKLFSYANQDDKPTVLSHFASFDTKNKPKNMKLGEKDAMRTPDTPKKGSHKGKITQAEKIHFEAKKQKEFWTTVRRRRRTKGKKKKSYWKDYEPPPPRRQPHGCICKWPPQWTEFAKCGIPGKLNPYSDAVKTPGGRRLLSEDGEKLGESAPKEPTGTNMAWKGQGSAKSKQDVLHMDVEYPSKEAKENLTKERADKAKKEAEAKAKAKAAELKAKGSAKKPPTYKGCPKYPPCTIPNNINVLSMEPCIKAGKYGGMPHIEQLWEHDYTSGQLKELGNKQQCLERKCDCPGCKIYTDKCKYTKKGLPVHLQQWDRRGKADYCPCRNRKGKKLGRCWSGNLGQIVARPKLTKKCPPGIKSGPLCKEKWVTCKRRARVEKAHIPSVGKWCYGQPHMKFVGCKNNCRIKTTEKDKCNPWTDKMDRAIVQEQDHDFKIAMGTGDNMACAWKCGKPKKFPWTTKCFDMKKYCGSDMIKTRCPKTCNKPGAQCDSEGMAPQEGDTVMVKGTLPPTKDPLDVNDVFKISKVYTSDPGGGRRLLEEVGELKDLGESARQLTTQRAHQFHKSKATMGCEPSKPAACPAVAKKGWYVLRKKGEASDVLLKNEAPAIFTSAQLVLAIDFTAAASTAGVCYCATSKMRWGPGKCSDQTCELPNNEKCANCVFKTLAPIKQEEKWMDGKDSQFLANPGNYGLCVTAGPKLGLEWCTAPQNSKGVAKVDNQQFDLEQEKIQLCNAKKCPTFATSPADYALQCKRDICFNMPEMCQRCKTLMTFTDAGAASQPGTKVRVEGKVRKELKGGKKYDPFAKLDAERKKSMKTTHTEKTSMKTINSKLKAVAEHKRQMVSELDAAPLATQLSSSVASTMRQMDRSAKRTYAELKTKDKVEGAQHGDPVQEREEKVKALAYAKQRKEAIKVAPQKNKDDKELGEADATTVVAAAAAAATALAKKSDAANADRLTPEQKKQIEAEKKVRKKLKTKWLHWAKGALGFFDKVPADALFCDASDHGKFVIADKINGRKTTLEPQMIPEAQYQAERARRYLVAMKELRIKKKNLIDDLQYFSEVNKKANKANMKIERCVSREVQGKFAERFQKIKYKYKPHPDIYIHVWDNVDDRTTKFYFCINLKDGPTGKMGTPYTEYEKLKASDEANGCNFRIRNVAAGFTIEVLNKVDKKHIVYLTVKDGVIKGVRVKPRPSKTKRSIPKLEHQMLINKAKKTFLITKGRKKGTKLPTFVMRSKKDNMYIPMSESPKATKTLKGPDDVWSFTPIGKKFWMKRYERKSDDMFEVNCKPDILTMQATDESIINEFPNMPIQEVAHQARYTVKAMGKLTSSPMKNTGVTMASSILGKNKVNWVDNECCNCSPALNAMYAAEERQMARIKKTKKLNKSQNRPNEESMEHLMGANALKIMRKKMEAMEAAQAAAAAGGGGRRLMSALKPAMTLREAMAPSNQHKHDPQVYAGLDFVQRAMAMADEMMAEKQRALR
jgi:hypothetical protein